ncbi:DUF1801 domain-containing protein [Lewinella sp. W8]|uniref:DUF1801 domain-containing protein n=1 Tax=Lewinella sp. W8 TaxID=2528208 RepID=UPI0015641D41|nr:DUF1801 domain-containing protein [Lewinella sp. W8]
MRSFECRQGAILTVKMFAPMEQVDNFIYRFDGAQRKILRYLHELLTEEFHLEAKIRYKIPFYYGRTWICYLNPIKNEGIEFAFVRGKELSNHQGVLDHRERVQVAGIEVYQLADFPREEMIEVIHEAVLLDETTPYRVTRRPKD